LDKSRRRFLRIGAETALAGYLSLVFLRNRSMARPPQKEGHVLVDLHVHLPISTSESDLVQTLSQGTVVGLADARNHPHLIGYENLLNLPGVEEIETGHLARITRKGSTGYLLRTQEVLDNDHHLLTFGIDGYVPEFNDPRRTVEYIQNAGCVVDLCHPGLIVRVGSGYWAPKTEQEEAMIYELAEMVDCFEEHNAASIVALEYKYQFDELDHMRSIIRNIRAKKGKHGISVSDTHHDPAQVANSGFYFPEDDLSVDALAHHCRISTTFDAFNQTFNRQSALKTLAYKYLN